MPLFSVTAIGLLAAVVGVTTRRAPPVRALLLGVGGAWTGFLGGAVVGVVGDVIAGTGWMVALAGHVAALAVAVGAIVSRYATTHGTAAARREVTS